MLHLKVLVRPNKDGWWAEVVDLAGCYSVGESLEHLKEMLREAISLHIEGMLEDGEEVHSGLIKGNYDFDLQVSIQDLFKHYPVTIKGVAERAGMNRTLLNHYAKGEKRMSEQQAFRITKAIHDIGRELVNLRV